MTHAELGSTVYRVADLHLRGTAGPIRSRAYWPAPTETAVRPALLVFFHTGRSPPGRWLCAAAGVVVLAAPGRISPPDAVAATGWAADHAAELAADPARLLVGGAGAGAGLAATVARQARDAGWPALTHQVLILPAQGEESLAGPVAGVAPATLVGGDRYAARLRRAGVPVEQVRYPDLARALRRCLQS
jgi:alpha/beta hydrolase fold